MLEQIKTCLQCGRDFPATTEYFHKHRRQRDGLYYYCKECNKARVKVWADTNRERKRQADRDAYKNNPEPYKKNARKWRKTNPDRKRENDRKWANDNREKERERGRDYYARNRQKESARGRQKYQIDKERFTERNKRWAKANPEKRQAVSVRRRARKRDLPDSLTSAQWQHCLDYFKGCCAVCERPMNGLFHKPHADHWIPLSDPNCPGTVVENMIPLCGGQNGCNQSKSSNAPAAWLESKFGKRKAVEILARINAYFDHVRANP